MYVCTHVYVCLCDCTGATIMFTGGIIMFNVYCFFPPLHWNVSSIITGPRSVSFTAVSLVPRTGLDNSCFVESHRMSELNK